MRLEQLGKDDAAADDDDDRLEEEASRPSANVALSIAGFTLPSFRHFLAVICTHRWLAKLP